ncbi:MAG: FeoA family protein [Trueperaceae bacterium]|nr:FeoA family protein [Trueperaceae bacterium]
MKPDGIAPVSGAQATLPVAGDRCELCPLTALGCGDGGRVVRLSGAPRIVRRLLALGVRPSTRCHVLGRTPSGGPLHVRAGSVHLMLRSDEASEVLIERDDGKENAHVVPAL